MYKKITFKLKETLKNLIVNFYITFKNTKEIEINRKQTRMITNEQNSIWRITKDKLERQNALSMTFSFCPVC